MKAEQFYQHPELGDDFWGQNRNYTQEDWVDEVKKGDTRLGYWDWVLSEIEHDKDSQIYDLGVHFSTFLPGLEISNLDISELAIAMHVNGYRVPE